MSRFSFTSGGLTKFIEGTGGKTLVVVFGLLLLFIGCYRTISSPAGDFANYYTASRLAITGSLPGVKLYDHHDFQQQIEHFFHGTLGSFIPFPPSTVLVMIPLAWLPPDTARLVFILVNLLSLIALIAMLHRLTKLSIVTVACLVLLDGISLWSDFRQGQIYLLVTLLIVAGIMSEEKGRHFFAGLLLGVVIPVKYFTILFVLYFLVKKNFRLVAGAAVASAFVFIAGILLTGVTLNEYYFAAILPQHLTGNIQDPFAVNFQSYASLFNRLFVHSETLNPHPIFDNLLIASWLKCFTSLWLLATLVIAIKSAWMPDSHDKVMYTSALLVLFGLVTSPAAAAYHLVLLIIPITFLTTVATSSKDDDQTKFLRNRLPLLVMVYVLINVAPFQLLYGSGENSSLQLLAYLKLGLLTYFFLLALPPSAPRKSLYPIALGSVALVSLGFVFIHPEPAEATDGAIWTKVDGLIIRNISFDNNSIYYSRESPHGFVSVKDGTINDGDPPLPRHTTNDGALTAFDSTVGYSREIFLKNSRTHNTIQLTKTPGRNSDPVWSDDDKRLYFLSDRGRGIDCTTIFYFPIDRLGEQ